MHTVLELFSPSGRTLRVTYWWLTVLFVAFIIAMGASRASFSQWTMTVVFAVTAAIFLSLTIRRLHDAGWSRWWILLGFIPFSIFTGFEPIQMVGFSVVLPDFSQLFRYAPFILALALPSAEIESEQETDGTLSSGNAALI